MGTIYQIPTTADANLRLLVNSVNDMISRHPDPLVARRWAEMASKTLLRYCAPPVPSQPVLDLDSVDGLSSEQKHQLRSMTELWLQSYFDDVRDQLMNVHGDMLKLQKAVAEFESGSGTQNEEDKP